MQAGGGAAAAWPASSAPAGTPTLRDNALVFVSIQIVQEWQHPMMNNAFTMPWMILVVSCLATAVLETCLVLAGDRAPVAPSCL